MNNKSTLLYCEDCQTDRMTIIRDSDVKVEPIMVAGIDISDKGKRTICLHCKGSNLFYKLLNVKFKIV